MNVRWIWMAVWLAGCARKADQAEAAPRLSRAGETCGRTADCEAPLRCVRFECVGEGGGRSAADGDTGGAAGGPAAGRSRPFEPSGPPATPAVPPPPPTAPATRSAPPTGL